MAEVKEHEEIIKRQRNPYFFHLQFFGRDFPQELTTAAKYGFIERRQDRPVEGIDLLEIFKERYNLPNLLIKYRPDPDQIPKNLGGTEELRADREQPIILVCEKIKIDMPEHI